MSTSANFSHRSQFLYTFVSTIGQNNIRGLFCTLSKAFLVHVTFSYHSCWVLDFEQRLHYSPDFFWCNQWKLVAWWRVWRFKKVKVKHFSKYESQTPTWHSVRFSGTTENFLSVKASIINHTARIHLSPILVGQQIMLLYLQWQFKLNGAFLATLVALQSTLVSQLLAGQSFGLA